MYDPKKYNIKPSPKAGSTAEATITEVKQGKVSDFVKGEGLSAWNDPNQECINVTATTKENTARSVLFTLPKDGSVPEKSKLGKYFQRYGKYPEIADKIQFVANKDGFYDFGI